MRKVTWLAAGALVLMLIQGCGPCDIPAAAAALGANLAIGNLTACQLQTLFNEGPAIAAQFGIPIPVNLPSLSEEQAEAIVAFLDQHNIVTVQELESALDSGTITEQDLPESLLEFYNQFQAENP